ncbi:MAG: ABC transporter ATP-binding protein [Chloroflexaceae bacterium]|nr:ABC transporter ATP-binding protein [Chloroflexaceae bacterium]
MDVLDIENLHKSYGRLRVLRGLNLRLTRGEVYGILGPTGAGKSTLIHILMGFLKPSDGTIQMLGTTNLETSRVRVGYLPEQMRYHLRYTAREYLTFLGHLSDMNGAPLRRRVEEELERTGLSHVANQKLATFSRGMLQRVGIAQALLANPPLLLLDEPTGGLDPVSRHEVLDILSRLRSPDRTILLCTHHIDEIEYLCDRAGVLINGRLVVEVAVHQVRGISPA